MDYSTTVAEAVIAAEQQIRSYVRETYLDFSPSFSADTACNVFFKLENIQVTGSFKVRGAVNKILSLTPTERAKGIVTASTGNHGAAVAYGLSQVGGNGTVFVPENAATSKLLNIQQWGARIEKRGHDGIIAETAARTQASETGRPFISPYNDFDVIAGQGTIGLELARQHDNLDAVFVSLGGGGLISGIAGYLKSIQPDTEIVACSPLNSQVMAESVRAGQILELESLPTLSDGTAGGVEAGSITFPYCQQLIDTFISVTEEEIAAALRLYLNRHHLLIEGSAAVAIAAFLQAHDRYKGKNVAIVLCGSNIDMSTLAAVLNS